MYPWCDLELLEGGDTGSGRWEIGVTKCGRWEIGGQKLWEVGDGPPPPPLLLFPTAIRACAIVGRFTLNNRKRPNSRMFRHASSVLFQYMIYRSSHGWQCDMILNQLVAYMLARSWYHICHSLIKIISHCHPCDNLHVYIYIIYIYIYYIYIYIYIYIYTGWPVAPPKK